MQIETLVEKIHNSLPTPRPTGERPVSDKEEWAEKEIERIQTLSMYHSILVDFQNELAKRHEEQTAAQQQLVTDFQILHDREALLQKRQIAISQRHDSIQRQFDVLLKKLEDRQKLYEYESFHSKNYWPLLEKVTAVFKKIQSIRSPLLKKMDQENVQILKLILNDNHKKIQLLRK